MKATAMRSGSSRASDIVREAHQLERVVAKLHQGLTENFQDKKLLALANRLLRHASRLAAKCEEALRDAGKLNGEAASEIEQESNGLLSAIGSVASIISLLSQFAG